MMSHVDQDKDVMVDKMPVEAEAAALVADAAAELVASAAADKPEVADPRADPVALFKLRSY